MHFICPSESAGHGPSIRSMKNTHRSKLARSDISFNLVLRAWVPTSGAHDAAQMESAFSRLFIYVALDRWGHEL